MQEIYLCRKVRSIYDRGNEAFFSKSLNILNQEKLGESFKTYEEAYRFSTGRNKIQSKNPYLFSKLPGVWVIFKAPVKKENIEVIDERDNSVKLINELTLDQIQGCFTSPSQ